MTGLTDDFWKQSPVSQQTPTPDVVGIAPELVERMVALVRRVAEHGPLTAWDDAMASTDEARAIVALLPEPVDGDWFKRNANRRDPKAHINTNPEYFASECASAIEGGTLVSVPSQVLTRPSPSRAWSER